jgi:cation diffusion facilitator family transporter
MVRKFVRNHERVENQRTRLGYVRLECWTSIFGNLCLGTAKLIFGVLTGSIALTADAAHTYGDMVSSVVLLVSMRLAVSPPDARHPHGHGRAEALGTLGLAALLLITAVEFAHPSFDRLVQPDPKRIELMSKLGWVMALLLLVFWAVKEWMAKFSADLGQAISSEALAGDAQHHRSDALATLLVVFSFVGAKFGVPWLDGLFGLGVTGFIGWAGLSLAWSMISRLMGEAPSEDLVAEIVAAAASIRGVRGVHGVEVHDYGNYKVASLHIEVASHLKTGESHKIATLVEDALRRRLGMSAVAHVEVYEPSKEPNMRSRLVEQVLAELVKTEPSVVGFHAVHIMSSDHQLSVDLHLIIAPGLPVEECHRLDHKLAAEIQKRLGAVKVNVHVESAQGAGR